MNIWRNSNQKVRIIWKILGILLLILYFSPLLFQLLPMAMYGQTAKDFFGKRNIPFTDSTVYVNGQKIHFISTGKDSAPMIVFIHGSPGGWQDMKDFLGDSNLVKKYHLLTFDRPGYGESGGPGYAKLSDQAMAVASLFIFNTSRKPITLMGHSYGGPVALKVGTMFPEKIGAMLLIAPTVAPDVEENIRIKRLAQRYSKWWGARWMMPDMTMHSTNEMQPLPNEVRRMEKDFSTIKCKVIEMHGTKDWLAPFPNQAYLLRHLNQTQIDTVTITGGDHFIVWTMHQKVVHLLEQITNSNAANGTATIKK